MDYQAWRTKVLDHMKVRGIENPEVTFKASESGPTASVPSTRELFEDGESPEDFVANEYFEGAYAELG